MLDMHFSYGAMRWLRGAAVAAVASAFVATPTFAAIPKTSLIDGALTSSGGSAAADGDYDIVFTIYDAASNGNATWTETAKVKVTGGRFSHALGSVSAIDSAKLIAANAHWLGLKVGTDPELPRQALHANLFSQVAGQALALTCDGCVGSNQLSNGGVAAAKVGFNYAGSSTKGGPAIDVECTGCVDVADIKFNGDVDLGANSLKSKNGTFSGDVTAATVTATSFVGDGSKLTGIKTPSGECKTAGEVVKGINADGSLKCIAALDPAALPKDGLNEISNDLLSNQFVDTIEGDKNIPIPDKTGTDAISNLVFPDIGTTQSFEVYVEVANTDLSAVSMTILPPDDKKTGWTLCDPCGEKDAKSFKVTFAANKDLKAGDLEKWIGANPKGTWNLKVLDNAYCIPQQSGNAALCDTTKQLDGTIVTWSIKIKTLSNKKIAINGDTYQGGTAYLKDVDVSGSLTIGGVKYNGLWTPPTMRFVDWSTYDNATSWYFNNDSSMFGGVNPSNWSDGNALASNMSANKDILRTFFNRKRWTGKNAMLYSEQHMMYTTSTHGFHAAALIRVKNTTAADIKWPLYYYYTSYGSWNEYASVALNGTNVWSTGTNTNNGTASVTMTIPKSRTSTVIVAVGSGPGHQWGYGYTRPTILGFYNNSLVLPAGLEYVDDFDTATGGWEQ